jgi:glycosyltransferase domain-containing protein
MKNNNFFKDITFVICTYNRENDILKTVSFWSKFSCNIIVLEGYKKSRKFENFFFDKNIKYFYKPVSVVERQAFAFAYHVKTKYAMLMTDDDFFLPSTILDCLDFLENDKKNFFSSCSGKVYYFNKNNSKYFFRKGSEIKKNINLTSIDKKNRIRSHLSKNYNSIAYYSVCRTAILKKTLSIVKKIKFSSYGLNELIIEFAILYYGKHKKFNKPFWFRNEYNFPIRDQNDHEPDQRTDVLFVDWYFNNKDYLIQILSNELSMSAYDVEDIFNNYYNYLPKKKKVHKLRLFIRVIVNMFFKRRYIRFIKQIINQFTYRPVYNLKIEKILKGKKNQQSFKNFIGNYALK